jgi:hypothetical protein
VFTYVVRKLPSTSDGNDHFNRPLHNRDFYAAVAPYLYAELGAQWLDTHIACLHDDLTLLVRVVE